MRLKLNLRRQQRYLAFGIICLMFLFVYRFLYGPTFSKIVHILRETKSKMKDISTSYNMLPNRDILSRQTAQIEADFENYQKRISTDASPSRMLEELTHIAEALKVSIIGVEPLAPVKDEITGMSGYYTQFPIKIKLKCGYHELGKFISQIENSSKLMKVEEVNLRDDPKDIWHHDVSMIISTFAYISEEK